MNVQEIMNSNDFKQCVSFHGHVCPGVSIGYKAAKAGMAWLKENRSEDEEIIAIVETNACSADAVQVLTGCTFGKGNFIHKDYGKMVLTLLSRNSGKGVRVAVKAGTSGLAPEHMELIRKMIDGKLTDTEQEQFQELHLQKSMSILETPDQELFTIRETSMELPQKARIEPSEPCSRCKEPVMKSKLKDVDGQMVCQDCCN
ncbi:FmdE family protein [Desulfobacula toluolica]|uniref:FwdE2: formlmethanofuran dehydrogenase, subunit E n=1 Tax=Desulfobacula toluolica (strain DSM 7467 / Tol2) TaxID=651182 RepID=K0NCV6_DESTT|nr:FmdE family protein [Desulfobacula toluolica]CCK78706.1 FwdE2: formlmethanofuran dehydrogenase, subunit E [Desulfobacula toluolica Tol2]